MILKILHQNQGSSGGEEQPVKKESEEMEELEEAQMRLSPENESVKENSPAVEISPAAASCSILLSGKRKRKPKELIDEYSTMISRKRKKKKTSSSKSGDGTPDCGGTSKSKGDASVGGSSGRIQMNLPTLSRALELQSSLGKEQPSFSKLLVRSHVASCFWMGLPVPFCKVHLPANDTIVFLETETGEAYGIKYIAHKTGLSAGWRKFVAGNKLLEGDVLVFLLIGPCRFKVYITRENELTEVDGALSLLNLDSQTKQTDAEETIYARNKTSQPKPQPLTVVQNKKKEEGASVHQITPLQDLSGNDSEEVGSEVLECSKFAGTTSRFNDVKRFEEFHVIVNGVCIDSDLPEHIRRKYYELCCSKNAYIHDLLLPGLSCKLAAGMIFEAVNTSDAIRDCKLTTPRQEFDVWEKSLSSFELLGLKVGFLRARLHLLLRLSFESEDAAETRRYWDMKIDRNRVEDEIQILEAKLEELKDLSRKYSRDVESLKITAESFELRFQEEANAPW